ICSIAKLSRISIVHFLRSLSYQQPYVVFGFHGYQIVLKFHNFQLVLDCFLHDELLNHVRSEKDVYLCVENHHLNTRSDLRITFKRTLSSRSVWRSSRLSFQIL
ncbi:hypothetical protein CVS40_7299, partial [Lucilia cuprina]